jgi:hypothetical protein
MNQHDAINEVFKSTANSPCILCQGPADFVGTFTPDNAERFGAVSGKSRVIFYGICTACAQEPDFDAIEEILDYTLTDKKITHH